MMHLTITCCVQEAEYVDWAQDLLGIEATAADAGGVLMDPEGMRARIEELLQGEEATLSVSQACPPVLTLVL